MCYVGRLTGTFNFLGVPKESKLAAPWLQRSEGIMVIFKLHFLMIKSLTFGSGKSAERL